MVTVLCYHHVDCAVKTDYSVTSAQLSAQIDALLASGFTFIDSRALESFYADGTPIPSKSALITFDDGNYDVYTYAYPLLRKRGIPFTFFVYPNAVNSGHNGHCVDWADLREMAANGVTIGSHTMTHPFLTKPPAAIANKAAYDAWLTNELVNSKMEIELKLGRPVTEFAVPFGAFDSYVKEKIRAAGYTLAFNVDGANSDTRADRMNINRIIVRASMSTDYFIELAAAPPIYFTANAPRDLSRVEAENTVVSFEIDGAQAFNEATVQSKVTSFSGLDLQHIREGDRFIESVDLRRPTFYGVYVWAKDRKGRLCRGSWLFIFEKTVPAYLTP
jgi:peptidoglycan/xylan/chitin deacetylase (PgdA/CDA1 family)